jgi:DNA-binding transcriptional ArsR family regulator
MTENAAPTLRRSVAIELSFLLSNLGGRPAISESAAIAEIRDQVPAEWREELADLLGVGRGAFSIPVVLAWIADVIWVEDYSRATRAMRHLDLPSLRSRLLERAAAMGLSPDADLEPGPALARLWLDMRRVGLGVDTLPELLERELPPAHPLNHLERYLRGGDLHDRLWHWLDRFHYQIYAGWREGRQHYLTIQTQRGTMLLGSGAIRSPLERLPPAHPLLNLPGLQRAAVEGQLPLAFLVEPFGIADQVLLLPGLILSTFAEPDASRELQQAFIQDLALRLKALADPTRLEIMRLMRHLELDNTQIATFLQVSRPTVSIHARQLREAGLIETRHEGRKARHTVQHDALRALFADLERYLDID